jgi:hypothetical protein
VLCSKTKAGNHHGMNSCNCAVLLRSTLIFIQLRNFDG